MKKAIIFIMFWAFPLILQAQSYRYIDESGNIYFVDSVDKIPQRYRWQVLPTPTPVATYKTGQHPRNTAPHKPKNPRDAEPGKPKSPKNNKVRVDVFLTRDCSECTKVVKFLQENRISFKTLDIEKSRKAAEEYETLQLRGVPIVRMGRAEIKGYHPNKILEQLKKPEG